MSVDRKTRRSVTTNDREPVDLEPQHSTDRRVVQRAESHAGSQPSALHSDAWSFGSAVNAGLGFDRVQFRGENGERPDALPIAAAGVGGPGGELPHRDAIQAAFGEHDVGSVRAHIGGDAATASEALGASAYAIGNMVAFRSAPDLHLAAHEAAHVIQQRGGVSLKGGVGETGDAHERHADAVADRVVSGQSAVDLLGMYSGGGGNTAVQLNPRDDEANTPGRAGIPAANRRQVITFIMGSPEPAGSPNPYFRAAISYWTVPQRTDVRVLTLRNFEAILTYLRTHPASSHLPWAEINIVSHGNEAGLAIPVHPGEHGMTTAERLNQDTASGQLHALEDSIVDAQTHVNVHACQAGANPETPTAIARAMGQDSPTDQQVPTVHAPLSGRLQSYQAAAPGHPARESHGWCWAIYRRASQWSSVDHGAVLTELRALQTERAARVPGENSAPQITQAEADAAIARGEAQSTSIHCDEPASEAPTAATADSWASEHIHFSAGGPVTSYSWSVTHKHHVGDRVQFDLVGRRREIRVERTMPGDPSRTNPDGTPNTNDYQQSATPATPVAPSAVPPTDQLPNNITDGL